MTWYRYGIVAYDSTSEEDMALLAADIVYYDESPLCEWAHFDEWLDANYKASDVYRIVTDKDVDAEIAQAFSQYMGENHSEEVVMQGLLDGAVKVIG